MKSTPSFRATAGVTARSSSRYCRAMNRPYSRYPAASSTMTDTASSESVIALQYRTEPPRANSVLSDGPAC